MIFVAFILRIAFRKQKSVSKPFFEGLKELLIPMSIAVSLLLIESTLTGNLSVLYESFFRRFRKGDDGVVTNFIAQCGIHSCAKGINSVASRPGKIDQHAIFTLVVKHPILK